MLYYKRNIVHIINALSVGGAESLLTHLLIDMKIRTQHVLDVAVLYSNNTYKNLLKSNGINVIELNMKRKYGLHIIFKLVRLIKKGKYDLVMAQLFPTTYYVALASFFLPKTKFILRETGISTRRRKYKLLKLLDTFVYSRYAKIICVDRKTKEELENWIPHIKNKTIVVYKGIPIPDLDMSAKKQYDIIFVGRLIKSKGVDTLLDAVALLRSQFKLGKVIIVGNGPCMNSLKLKSAKLHLSNIVQFLGARNDVQRLLQLSRIFVLPSKSEGTPSAVLEAMVSELPVISTKVGGTSEIIEDGVTGILVQPQSPKELAEAIETVLTDKQLATSLGENAARRIRQNYSIEQYSTRILELYNELLLLGSLV